MTGVFAARHALLKLYAACDDPSECAFLWPVAFVFLLVAYSSSWLSALAGSRWMRQVSELLAAAKDTLSILQSGTSVVIRSAEGTPYTSAHSTLRSLILRWR